jgi:hypothetical protein
MSINDAQSIENVIKHMKVWFINNTIMNDDGLFLHSNPTALLKKFLGGTDEKSETDAKLFISSWLKDEANSNLTSKSLHVVYEELQQFVEDNDIWDAVGPCEGKARCRPSKHFCGCLVRAISEESLARRYINTY